MASATAITCSTSRSRSWPDDVAPVDDTGLTRAGTVMGTLRYMSPEQARGEAVGVAADIYALGAVLFHVLTGRPPFSAVHGPDILARVSAGEVEDLHALAPAIPRGLAAIAERAMARRPEARYPSAARFAEDLRRFQAGRMVSAHTYSLREIVGLWWRRHRMAASVAALAAGALTLTVVVAFVEVRQEQREALRNLARAEQAERAATINLKTAETAVLRFLSGLADDPRLQEEDHLALRKQLLAGAIPLLQQLTAEGPDGGGLELVRGQAFLRLAELCLETGDYGPALASAREAAALFAGLQARQLGDSEPGRHEVTALRIQVKVLAQLARWDERDEVLRHAVELAERLTAADPDDPELAFEYARALNDLGLRDLDGDPGRSQRWPSPAPTWPTCTAIAVDGTRPSPGMPR